MRYGVLWGAECYELRSTVACGWLWSAFLLKNASKE